MRGDVKKVKVFVKDPKSGNVKKVNFGHGGTSAKKRGEKTMKIRRLPKWAKRRSLKFQGVGAQRFLTAGEG